MSTARVYLGLISGTSADGIDAALVRFDHPQALPRLLFGRTYPWDHALGARLVALGQANASLTLEDFAELDVRIGVAFADAALAALSDSGLRAVDVTAIGSHGQTLRHRPSGTHPFSLQLGDPNTIAERTGICTVADFRRRDVAAGGHGAPLVPGLHAALLSDASEDRAVLNLGGIGNFTLLPAHGAVRGFDTGPANGLMDAWCRRHTEASFDRDGALAASGTPDAALLARLLDDPWFALPPPKSTGRDQFNAAWLDAHLANLRPDGDARALSIGDVQATLLALSATTIADALRAAQPGTARVIACGGGVHNGALMNALADAMPGVVVESTAAHGIDPDMVEAMAFAWLARETLESRPGNVPTVTGARGPRVLGGVFAP